MPKCLVALDASMTPSLKSARMRRTKRGGRRWMICFFSRQEDGAPCADGTIKENRPASAMGGGIFRRINAASPSASAPLRPPPSLHLCGSQLEYGHQTENSTFEPSQSTFEQAPTAFFRYGMRPIFKARLCASFLYRMILKDAKSNR